MNVRLSQRIHELEDEWVDEHREAAQSRTIESQLIYAQFLITGAGSMKKDIPQAIHYLKLASKKSAEACLKLGKLYAKGTKVTQNFKEAYFYLRVATLFKCRCGSFAEQYHNRIVSNPHVCYPTDAMELLKLIPSAQSYEEQFRDQFNAWRRA